MKFGLCIREYEKLRADLEKILKEQKVTHPIFILKGDSILYKIGLFEISALRDGEIYEIAHSDIFITLWKCERKEYERGIYKERQVLSRATCLREIGWDSPTFHQDLVRQVRFYRYSYQVPSLPVE